MVSCERGGLWLDSQRQVLNGSAPRHCRAHTNTLLQQRDKVMIIAQRILPLVHRQAEWVFQWGKDRTWGKRVTHWVLLVCLVFGSQGIGAPDGGWGHSWSHLYASVAKSSKQQHTEAHRVWLFSWRKHTGQRKILALTEPFFKKTKNRSFYSGNSTYQFNLFLKSLCNLKNS